MPSIITSPDDPALADLCGQLAARAEELDSSGHWPAEQLQLCGEYGVYQWFIDPAWGGQAWDHQSVLRGYLALAGACLTTTFILTQRDGACRRIQTSANEPLKARLLPALTTNNMFATVGISHLTTSRRHLATPVLRARRVAGGFELDGFSPWVTGGDNADCIVLGATLMDGDGATREQLLAAVPTDLPGVKAAPPERLVGLSASHTGRFELDKTFIADELVLAGPVENVMSVGAGAGTGGLGTTTLALGLTKAALAFLTGESQRRDDLRPPSDALADEALALEVDLFAAVRGQPHCSNDELRQRANSLVLRAAQAALAAAKGSGYVAGHPAGRWCREALFFLVWSCPQPVLSANLCELAGILD
jgi:alkylation response protein AidB-like acyl-CoA dehydrogenase